MELLSAYICFNPVYYPDKTNKENYTFRFGGANFSYKSVPLTPNIKQLWVFSKDGKELMSNWEYFLVSPLLEFTNNTIKILDLPDFVKAVAVRTNDTLSIRYYSSKIDLKFKPSPSTHDYTFIFTDFFKQVKSLPSLSAEDPV